jgi:predicted PhzF superfamily epimerase YddE/YHI9
MQVPYYHVHAFTSRVFGGNPAGVCVLEHALPDALMQRIAAQNNLSETAFTLPKGENYALRWFTPTMEVDLCGHATLATAHVLFHERGFPRSAIRFESASGPLCATRCRDHIELDFPSREPNAIPAPPALLQGLGGSPQSVWKSRDYMAVYKSEVEVAALTPNLQRLAELDGLGVIATAVGMDCDFVSRFFAPKAGIAEDPVTGSAHCSLIPYWAKQLGKHDMFARQISHRGGELHCTLRGDRVGIAGGAVTYSRGELDV